MLWMVDFKDPSPRTLAPTGPAGTRARLYGFPHATTLHPGLQT